MSLYKYFQIIRDSFTNWNSKGVRRLGGSVAYYAASSLLALVLLLALMATILLNTQDFRAEIVRGVREFIGGETAQSIESAIMSMSEDIGSGSPVTTIVTVIVLIYTASRLFRHLKEALNLVWDVPEKEDFKVRRYIKDVLVSMVVVLLVSALLLIVLLLNSVALTAVTALDSLFPEVRYVTWLQLGGILVLFSVMTFFFAMLYRFMPDTDVRWQNVWIGAAMTSLLFTAGQLLLNTYIDFVDIGTLYGAAGAFMLLLLWVYVAAQIMLFGAIFTKVYTQHREEQQTAAQPVTAAPPPA